jgi:hypothetical protein
MLVLRDSELIADAAPREVFSNYELMHSTHLTPPQITELSVRLRHHKDDLKEVKLSVDEMTEYTLQTVKENQGGA